MIGLLQCDHVDPKFESIGGDYDAMFRRWLPADWKVYDVTRFEGPAQMSECDAYVTTGAGDSVYDPEPWIDHFASLVRGIREAGNPFLGVCFGHQMMAHALGGHVSKSPRGWGVGVHEFRVISPEPWMQPPLASFRVLMSCQDQVDELPEGSVVLAESSHCPVGMFRLGNMLGLQGHPEFSPRYAEALMEKRESIIGEEAAASARATLDQTLHAAELASWARHFFRT